MNHVLKQDIELVNAPISSIHDAIQRIMRKKNPQIKYVMLLEIVRTVIQTYGGLGKVTIDEDIAKDEDNLSCYNKDLAESRGERERMRNKRDTIDDEISFGTKDPGDIEEEIGYIKDIISIKKNNRRMLLEAINALDNGLDEITSYLEEYNPDP